MTDDTNSKMAWLAKLARKLAEQKKTLDEIARVEERIEDELKQVEERLEARKK